MRSITAKSIFKYSLNLGIRGATIGFKFLLALFLGKYFHEEVLGEYGLFSATILVSYLVLSLNFDGYAARELIQSTRDQQPTFVRDTFIFFFISFLVYVSIATFFLTRGIINEELIIYFIVLLLLETITQILFSLFTILQKPTTANVVMFLSQGAWILAVFCIWLIRPEAITSLVNIMMAWIIGGLFTCLYGFMKVHQLYKGLPLHKINWKWIKSGLSISMLFFCSLLGYKIVEFADRYFIEFKLGTDKVGIYVFYSQIANMMNAVINVTVILMLYPRLIDNYMKRDFKAYLSIKRKMYQRVMVIGVTTAAGAIIFIKIALTFIGKESFYEDISVFYLLLLSNIAMNLSFISNYCLFAMREDTKLVYTTLAGAICSLTLNYFLIDLFNIHGAAIATTGSFILMWILKTLFVARMEGNQFRI